MDDTENNSGNYKTLKTSTETILKKNSEMLEFVPDQLTTKRCVKLQLKTWGL